MVTFSPCSFAGTVFLWMYWPSFNAALVAPDYVAQHRSVINTYFSLSAACVTTFAISPIFQRRAGKWRMSMVNIFNKLLFLITIIAVSSSLNERETSEGNGVLLLVISLRLRQNAHLKATYLQRLLLNYHS